MARRLAPVPDVDQILDTARFDVHPAAAVWPTLPEDELRALADDIKANGLIHPIVIDAANRILDGRNRLAACELAGVEPAFVLHTVDPIAFILGANARRRHMSKGAVAMAAWQAACLENKQSQRAVSDSIGANPGNVGRASVVARWAPDLVGPVIAGTESLDAAYKTARDRKAEHDSHGERLGRLPEDLADLVEAERMTLSEAEAAHRRREQDVADKQRATRAWFGKVVALVDFGADADPVTMARELVDRLVDVTDQDRDVWERAAALVDAVWDLLRGGGR